MKIATTEGREIHLSQDTLDALKMRLRGSLFVPDEAAYEESRTVIAARGEDLPIPATSTNDRNGAQGATSEVGR